MPTSTRKIRTYGEIVRKKIENIKKSYGNIDVDMYVIMPNHIHLIIEIGKRNGSMKAATPTIAKIVRTLKGLITKESGFSIFQRNYYEHIIRNEKEYIKIREYIHNNPLKWKEDKLNY